MILFAILVLIIGAGFIAFAGTGANVNTAGNVTETPQASKVQLLASAIASAEGFGQAGAIPTRAHNPGDLAVGDQGLGVLGPSRVTVFDSDATGWSKLYSMLNGWFAETSSIYSLDDAIRDIARKYVVGPAAAETQDSLNWANNVASLLGVTIDTTLREWSAQ